MFLSHFADVKDLHKTQSKDMASLAGFQYTPENVQRLEKVI